MNEREQHEQILSFAITGVEAETFQDSRLGRYMEEMIASKEQAADQALRKADPEDPKLIRSLQNELAVCDLFRDFIKCAIESGKAAQIDLERRTAFD